MTRGSYSRAPVLLVAVLWCACQASEPVGRNPVPVPGDTLTPGTGGGPVTPPPDAGARIRTVTTRNPLGGPSGNLLVDGDFEFSVTRGWGQFGWYSWGQTTRAETGGLCRTGLRCVVLESGGVLVGMGTSANGAPMVASVWAKVPEGRACELVRAYALPCSGIGETLMAPVAEQPDADGWCSYEAHLGERIDAMCMYITSEVKYPEEVLVDSAQIIAATGAAPMAATAGRPATAAEKQRMRAVAEWVRKRRRFGR